jgi:putative ABC transport system ATP-binding protein
MTALLTRLLDAPDNGRRDGIILEARDLTKRYPLGETTVHALRGVSLTVGAGEFVALMGPSGSGKSTLLQLLGGLDRPSSGEVVLEGEIISELSDDRATRLRRDRTGFVFQSFNLIPSLTAELNVALPSRLAGKRPPRRAVRDALGAVGLADRARHLPAELSGGQQQRVAIARALFSMPAVVFADEPTGALDSASGRQVLGLLRGLADRATVIMVTHDPVAAATADRVLFLADGRLAGELHEPTAPAVAAAMTRLELAAGDRTAAGQEVQSGSPWPPARRGPARAPWPGRSSPWPWARRCCRRW